MKRFLVCLLTLACALSAFAQDPQPSEKFRDIEWMLGEWTGTMKLAMMGQPEMEMASSMNVEMDGFFMKALGTSEMDGAQMTETSYIAWDEKANAFKVYTFTTFAPTPRIETMTVNGDNAVFVSEPWDVPGMPEGVTSRVTLTKKGTDELVMLLEFKQGDEWMKVGEANYKKKT